VIVIPCFFTVGSIYYPTSRQKTRAWAPRKDIAPATAATSTLAVTSEFPLGTFLGGGAVKTVFIRAFIRAMGLACMLSFGLVSHVWAITYTYSNIQVPGAVSTSPTGINNKGDVIGNYQTSSDDGYGFLLSNGSYTTISCPGATAGTFIFGINDHGVMVGYYSTETKSWGFVYENGVCKSLPEFNGSMTYPTAIDNTGDIVGFYYVAATTHAFLLRNGSYADISVPNSNSTVAYGVNRADDISGAYYDSIGSHGFLLANGTYQTLDAPGAAGKTVGFGLNDQDIVVGNYEDSKLQTYEGFAARSGKFMELIVPGSKATFATDINDRNIIVGSYFTGPTNPIGFMATPSANDDALTTGWPAPAGS
jgi:hypothetical protein